MGQAAYLIVEQQLKAPENSPEILATLAQRHNLDPYLCRQCLTGQGLSLLTKGSPEALAPIAADLQQFNYNHWLVEPGVPKFVPARMRRLTITSNRIIFETQKGEVIFPRGANILAIFAETSGALADKSVTQLLSSHAYRGKDDIRHLTESKIHKTILQGDPVLDLYLLDDGFDIIAGVRAFPGKFDPKGLGERASLSSKQNVQQLLNLA